MPDSEKTVSASDFKKVCGIVWLRPGANLGVKGPDGKMRQLKCLVRSRYPKAKAVVRCQYCMRYGSPSEDGKTRAGEWPSEKAMLEAHPEHSVMVKQDETHLVYMFSTDEGFVDDKDQPTFGAILTTRESDES